MDLSKLQCRVKKEEDGGAVSLAPIYFVRRRMEEGRHKEDFQEEGWGAVGWLSLAGELAPKLLCQPASVCSSALQWTAVQNSGSHTEQPKNIHWYSIQTLPALHLCCMLMQCCSICCELLQINLLQPGNHLGGPPPPNFLKHDI